MQTYTHGYVHTYRWTNKHSEACHSFTLLNHEEGEVVGQGRHSQTTQRSPYLFPSCFPPTVPRWLMCEVVVNFIPSFLPFSLPFSLSSLFLYNIYTLLLPLLPLLLQMMIIIITIIIIINYNNNNDNNNDKTTITRTTTTAFTIIIIICITSAIIITLSQHTSLSAQRIASHPTSEVKQCWVRLVLG